MVPEVSMIDKHYRVVRNERKYVVEINLPDALGSASWQMIYSLVKEDDETFTHKGALPENILALLFDKILVQDKEIMQLRLAKSK